MRGNVKYLRQIEEEAITFLFQSADGRPDSQRPSEMKLLQEQLNSSDDATNAAAAAAALRHGRGFFDEIMEYLDENGRDSANGRYA